MDKEKRIKQIFRTLRPYVNGRLITPVFEKYFNELEELVLELQKGTSTTLEYYLDKELYDKSMSALKEAMEEKASPYKTKKN